MRISVKLPNYCSFLNLCVYIFHTVHVNVDKPHFFGGKKRKKIAAAVGGHLNRLQRGFEALLRVLGHLAASSS